MNVRRKQTSEALADECQTFANSNTGCGVRGPTNSSGTAFNDNGGGIFATEWRSDGIRMWFFSRGNEPEDLANTTTTGAPDPSTWGEPTADFPNIYCDIGKHFRNASIIMNIALCGDWAGATSMYSDQGDCPGTCQSFVANDSIAFEEAYREIKSFKVFLAV
jgi:hypothetical protein